MYVQASIHRRVCAYFLLFLPGLGFIFYSMRFFFEQVFLKACEFLWYNIFNWMEFSTAEMRGFSKPIIYFAWHMYILFVENMCRSFFLLLLNFLLLEAQVISIIRIHLIELIRNKGMRINHAECFFIFKSLKIILKSGRAQNSAYIFPLLKNNICLSKFYSGLFQ